MDSKEYVMARIKKQIAEGEFQAAKAQMYKHRGSGTCSDCLESGVQLYGLTLDDREELYCWDCVENYLPDKEDN
jgi:hypothetical protein